MSPELWMSYIALSLAAVFSPGPAVLLAISHGARYGALGAIPALLGNISGLAILSTAAAFGIGGVLEASGQAFMILRVVGGFYLVFMGVRMALGAGGLKAALAEADASTGRPPRRRRRRYLQGVLVALSNPKALLFVGALYPQFVDISRPVPPQLAALAATLMAFSFSGLMIYASASGKILGGPAKAYATTFNRIAGGLFIALGLALAFARR